MFSRGTYPAVSNADTSITPLFRASMITATVLGIAVTPLSKREIVIGLISRRLASANWVRCDCGSLGLVRLSRIRLKSSGCIHGGLTSVVAIILSRVEGGGHSLRLLQWERASRYGAGPRLVLLYNL